MKLSYCERCSALITDRSSSSHSKSGPLLCPECLAHPSSKKHQRNRARDSGLIPASKLLKARRLGGHK